MDNSNEFRKQKRLGPAPIASFEKSFEDNTSPQGNNSSTTLTAATTTTTIITEINVIVHGNNDENKSNMDLGKVQIQETKDTSTADKIQNQQQQQQQPSISVSTPSRKLHDIGKKLPPLQVLAGDVGGVEGGGDGDGGGGGFGVGGVIESNYGNTKIIEGKIKIATKLGIATPSTPRIDISRASSSSHHDSRDSSPENVFEQVGTGTLQETIGLGFREEGALDLRSSTEELYFMDPEQKKEEQEKLQQTRKSPIIFKFDDHQAYLQQHQRKDSASSEVAALLCISGRTSRISSVGSQGSAVSRLSAISGVSRSPSPHRMLLETSFCGPKPLDNTVSSNIIGSVEPPTAEALEQILLSRKHDPTQAVLAEGIHIETSPKKQLTNGETKTTLSMSTLSKTSKMQNVGHKTTSAASKKATITRRDSGKQIIGVTPGGTEYIRIKLKPDHMYEDHGLGQNERVIEVSTTSSGAVQKKPVSLSIGRDISGSEQRLTPSSSPKPSRHGIFTRDIGGSRSPSPAMVTVSRKSSFCSLFKTKDSPDSPRDRSRSRSKSRDRSTPQSQSGTPSKQKSVLAIFKPKRSGSKSKCSSPIDQDTVSQFDGISQVEFKFKSDSVSEQPSRPSSRLRYYDTPLDGKSIHIPLHTPPEEKEDRKFIINKEMKASESTSFPTEITNVVESPKAPRTEVIEQAPSLPPKSPKPPQLEKIQRIENLDAIHSLPEDVCEKERTWSLEVQRHSSQESQEIIAHENTTALPVRRISKPTLTNVIENPEKENRIPPIVSQVQNIIPSVTEVTVQAQQHTAPTSREKRRILFATKLGSGSEEQIFSTQFSLSKTESLSSQLSEQTIPESPAAEGRESLHRTDTVIRRTEDMSCSTGLKKKDQFGENKQESSFKDNHKSTVVATIEKRESIEENKLTNSKPVSVGDDKKPIVVMMRKKDSLEESKRKSKSTSEEDDNTHRHSRYIENFDVKKKFQENNAKWQLASKNSSDSSIKERDSCASSREDQDNNTQIEAPTVTTKSKYFEPSITLPQPSVERQSMVSTDEPAESSESERDSEMDPNRIKRHLPRHIGAIEDHESTGLVSQDSFEDELPYVPTTLPEERAHGVSLIPMKERVNMELKTCPVDRPRSTTPMNPACLEEYCGIITPDDVERTPIRGEKLRISLPRKDSIKDRAQKSKSPRRVSNSSGKSWFEFAEHGIRGQAAMPVSNQQQIGEERRNSLQDDEPPPPLPPRKPSNSTTGQWVNFENIPEKRKPPKRITALPKDSPQESSKLHSTQPPIHYNYVKPEECQCECHEIERESAAHKSIASVDLLQQGEDMQPLLEPEVQEGIDPSDSSLDYSYGAEGLEDIHESKTYEKVSTLRQTKSNKLQ